MAGCLPVSISWSSILILIRLRVGPCIFTCMGSCIRQRINSANAQGTVSNYALLEQDESMIWLMPTEPMESVMGQDSAEVPPSYILAEAIPVLTMISSPYWRIPWKITQLHGSLTYQLLLELPVCIDTALLTSYPSFCYHCLHWSTYSVEHRRHTPKASKWDGRTIFSSLKDPCVPNSCV